jgi:hypothetical protein
MYTAECIVTKYTVIYSYIYIFNSSNNKTNLEISIIKLTEFQSHYIHHLQTNVYTDIHKYVHTCERTRARTHTHKLTHFLYDRPSGHVLREIIQIHILPAEMAIF